jgi:hypothetical protein
VIAVLLIVVGPVGPTTTISTATAVVIAPDDGHEDARNMLSCI